MKSLKFKNVFLLFLSGSVAAYVVLNGIFLLSWICYVPFFILFKKLTAEQKLTSSIIFSFGVSAVTFFWMIGAAKQFSGNQWFYALLVTFVSVTLFAIYCLVLMYVLTKLEKIAKSTVFKGVLVASSFVLGEWLLALIFVQMPYYLYNSGYGLLNNLYSVQWVAHLGLPMLNFITILINYLVAENIATKQWKKMLFPATIVAFFMLTGFLMKFNFDKNLPPTEVVKIAVAAENIPANLRWDEQGGNILASRLLAINRQAATLNPDLVLWSESTIPWPYNANDDLLLEILKEPYSSEAIHVIGFMTAYDRHRMFNSAYAISSKGKLVGRYDKRYPLAFVETQVWGLNMPFLDLDGYLIKEGQSAQPITTLKGKAGVVICNEIAKPKAATTLVRNGAEFLLMQGNDGWFKDTYLVNVHFLYSRLSAVANRKDIVLNNNDGFSGHIKANGEVLLKRKSNDFFVETAFVSPNSYDNAGRFFPNLIPLLCIIIILSTFLLNLYQSKPNS